MNLQNTLLKNFDLIEKHLSKKYPSKSAEYQRLKSSQNAKQIYLWLHENFGQDKELEPVLTELYFCLR